MSPHTSLTSRNRSFHDRVKDKYKRSHLGIDSDDSVTLVLNTRVLNTSFTKVLSGHFFSSFVLSLLFFGSVPCVSPLRVGVGLERLPETPHLM